MKPFTFITTDDGTMTALHAQFNEAMHTTDGAFAESIIKHVFPSGILELSGPRTVLDVGFGIGYNILALLVETYKHKFEQPLTIVSLEKDRSVSPMLESIRFNDERDKWYNFVKAAFDSGRAVLGNCSLSLFFDDARLSIKGLESNRFDAVFHDPFSPAKNPELWTVEFFNEVYRVMKQGALLTTYSSAPQIRRALQDAGFILGRGPGMGKKREGTIAAKGASLEPLSPEILSEVGIAIAFHDETLSDSRECIRNRRASAVRNQQNL